MSSGLASPGAHFGARSGDCRPATGGSAESDDVDRSPVGPPPAGEFLDGPNLQS